MQTLTRLQPYEPQTPTNTHLNESGLSAYLDEHLTEQMVFDAIVETQGNSALGSELILERLNLEFTSDRLDAVRKRIPSLLVSRMSELKQHMEAISTLELFSLMPLLHKTLKENLTALEPGESVTAYMKLMELIGKKTDANELTINVNDRRFGSMPRHLQQLFMSLEASGQIENVVEGQYRELPSNGAVTIQFIGRRTPTKQDWHDLGMYVDVALEIASRVS